MNLGRYTLPGLLAPLALCISSHALAVSIPGDADVEISLNGVNASTTQYDSTLLPCNSIGDCDSAAITPAPGGIGSEDSWGVGNINAINDANTLDTYFSNPTSGTNGERLGFMFYDITDYDVSFPGGGTEFQALSVSGFVDIYLYTDTNGVDISGGPAARVDLDDYNGLTDKTGATLWLRLALTPGIVAGDNTTTFRANFETTDSTGSSRAYADVVGGSAAALFDTSAQIDNNGVGRDFLLDLTVNSQNVPVGWTLRLEGESVGQTTSVPTPGTLLLLGAGMLGIGTHRVRRARREALAS